MMSWVMLSAREVAERDARAARERAGRTPVGAPRCSCGRFVARGGRCSLEVPVYRDGSFVGHEHL